MHRLVVGRAVVLAVVLAAFATACGADGSPELRVLGLHDSDDQRVVFVQVTNPAGQSMRLTRLDYAFEASGRRISAGELPLSRDVPSDSTVVLEVPLAAADVPAKLKLEGKLTAQLADLERTFPVEADVRTAQ